MTRSIMCCRISSLLTRALQRTNCTV